MTLCVCLAGAVAAAGCGSDDSAGSKDSDAGPAKVRMATLGVASDAALRLGVEKGLFKKDDIDLKMTVVDAGGAAIAPALLKGEYDVAGGGIDGPLLAQAKGLDLKVLSDEGAPVSKGTTPKAGTKLGTTGLAVPKGSNVKSLADLRGQPIAGITVTGLQYLCVAGAMEKAGVDKEDVEVLEIPAPEMLPALAAGRVKAAALVEPFLTVARQQGYRILDDPCVDSMPGAIQAGYFTSSKWAKQNPELAARLGKALTRANRYAVAHPDEVRAAIPKYTKIKPQVAKEITLSPYDTSGKNTLGTVADQLVAYDLVDQKPDTEGILTGAGR